MKPLNQMTTKEYNAHMRFVEHERRLIHRAITELRREYGMDIVYLLGDGLLPQDEFNIYYTFKGLKRRQHIVTTFDEAPGELADLREQAQRQIVAKPVVELYRSRFFKVHRRIDQLSKESAARTLVVDPHKRRVVALCCGNRCLMRRRRARTLGVGNRCARNRNLRRDPHSCKHGSFPLSQLPAGQGPGCGRCQRSDFLQLPRTLF